MIVLCTYDDVAKAIAFTTPKHLGWLKEEHDAFGDNVRAPPFVQTLTAD